MRSLGAEGKVTMVDINIGHQHWTSYLKDMLDINTTTGTLGSRSPEQVTCLEATRTMGTTDVLVACQQSSHLLAAHLAITAWALS